MRAFIAILMLILLSGPVAAGPASYQPTASIAALQAYGAASAGVGHATVACRSASGACVGGGDFAWTTGVLCNAVTGGGDLGTTFCASDGAGGYLTSGYWLRQFTYGVLHTDWFVDTDIGAVLNDAYAALPSYGGTILIDCPASGHYDFTTPVAMTVSGKYPLVIGECPSGRDSAHGGVVLNYTPPTATAAITVDYADVHPGSNSGFRNISLVNNNCTTSAGCGSSAIGIKVGTTYFGDAVANYQNVTINGFGTAYQNYNSSLNAVAQVWSDLQAHYNTVVLRIGGAVTEDFMGGEISSNGRILVSSDANGTSDLYFFGTVTYSNYDTAGPLFDYTGGGATSVINMFGFHAESAGSTGFHLMGGNFDANIHGGIIEDDGSTGTCDWMINPTTNYNRISLTGTRLLSSCLFTQFLLTNNLVTGTLAPIIGSPTNLPTLVGGTQASLITVTPINNFGITGAWSIYNPLTIRGGTTILTGLTFARLAQSATNPSVASGFGTGAAVSPRNGTAFFLIGVGTGGTASSGVVTMPAATSAWGCDAADITNSASFVEAVLPTSATSITITNYPRAGGAATPWTASDNLQVKCTGG